MGKILNSSIVRKCPLSYTPLTSTIHLAPLVLPRASPLPSCPSTHPPVPYVSLREPSPHAPALPHQRPLVSCASCSGSAAATPPRLRNSFSPPMPARPWPVRWYSVGLSLCPLLRMLAMAMAL